MNKNKTLLLLSILGAACLASPVNAAVIYESFSGYTTDPLPGSPTGTAGQTTSGTGLFGGWIDSGTALASTVNFNGVSTGLTYSQGSTELSVSGGAMIAFRTSGFAGEKGIQVGVSSFDTDLPGEVWMSVLVDFSGAQTGSAMLGVTIDDANELAGDGSRAFGIGIFNGNVGAVQAADGTDLDQPNGAFTADDTGLALATGVNLIVAKITDSPDTMTVWLNPTLGVEPTTGGATLGGPASRWVAGNASWGITSLFATHDFAEGSSVVMDEFRYGNTFADVTPVPEPSTFALLSGLLVLGCAVVRRRLA